MRSLFAIAVAGALAAPCAARAAFDARRLNALFDNNGSPDGDPQPVPAPSLPSAQPISSQELRAEMLQNLDSIGAVFKAQYGPGQYKESRLAWNLERELNEAKRKVAASPAITIGQYQEILRQFFASVKDYHVEVEFDATEASTLPFAVIAVGGRYFIAAIDRQRLPASEFPFHVGDELVSFGGAPVEQAVSKLQAGLGGNSEATDQALAASELTRRKAEGRGQVERGPVAIGVKPMGSSEVVVRQLEWDYEPELVAPPGGIGLAALRVAKAAPPFAEMDRMLSPVPDTLASKDVANPFSLGNRDGFVPALGRELWRSGKEDAFRASIYALEGGRRVGFVRIPTYDVDDAGKRVEAFAALVRRFQSSTDALVIDETDNPGGSVLYLYALASMLTDRPLSTPKHEVAITQDDVSDAADVLKVADAIKTDADARQALGDSEEGYPVTLDLFQHTVAFSRFVVDQWNHGKTLTDPTFIEGVDAIAPSSKAAYTKPILMLVNELDFSGGDFFPAILQDNRRATIFGARTAGAGGFVREVRYPNRLGVRKFTLTGSVAVRADGSRIENEGVKPDIPYAPTAADAQGGWSGYAAAVDAALEGLWGSGR